MLPRKTSALWIALACLALSACTDSQWASNLERSLAADPSLENGSLFGAGANSPSDGVASSPATVPQLPANFPGEIPRYPNAELVEVIAPDRSSSDLSGNETTTTQTRWQSSDSTQEVRQFYQEQFQSEGWQLVESSGDDAGRNLPATLNDSSAPLVAERDGLQVTVTIPAAATGDTEFAIDYQFSNNAAIAQSPTGTGSVSRSEAPQPGDPDFVGPVAPDRWQASSTNRNNPSAAASTDAPFTDLNQAPAELQSYIRDLAELGALPLQSDSNGSNSAAAEFQPNAEITRREYARWLFTANNLIYANQPTRRVRSAVGGQPAFQDVPASDPDFGIIQGLANAGLLPSPLSGDSTVVTFRPDAPLTREDLLLWKVPLDLRQALPNATIEAVQQTWGFQDVARIDPKALRAVLADYQNGDLSNIRRAFGYTTLFQPKKPATRAEAAAALWFFGSQGDGLSAQDALQIEQSGTEQSGTEQSSPASEATN
ncbi:MAG: S-layer homology domain-containing protein [Elainellaceae cyanobacterium]